MKDSPAYLPGAFEVALGSLAAVPRIADSFRIGDGRFASQPASPEPESTASPRTEHHNLAFARRKAGYALF
jgi:hypothetical protein